MRSVMAHSFAEVPRANIPRSSFNRSHGHKTTFDADYLYPLLVDDVVPGDTFNVNMHFFCRLATPLYPIMDNMYFESFFFFVPYRIIWDNWTKMHGEQDNPADSIDFTVPALSSSTTVNLVSGNQIYNYWGLPYRSSVDFSEISALPSRAYVKIWNDWFRDENLQDSLTEVTGNGPDTTQVNDGTYNLKKRGKRHDYFTSCLPWPQKGDAVSLPLGSAADVFSGTAGGGADYTIAAGQGSTSYVKMVASTANVSHTATTGSSADRLQADLTNATAATINDLRLAFQTQRLLERDARSGTRYNELILSHFGVTVPDFRIQRPEFLGGGSSPINITPVANTSATATEDQGDLAGFGTVSGSHGFTKSFTEHGVLIALINVRGDITYSQGLERYWTKQTRYDFYYPVLSQIGEQSVLNGELYYQNTSADDDVFGYQERYAEYRYKPSRLSGLMRVDHATSLSAWHLSEDFASLPTLGDTFIQSNLETPLDRAIAVPSEPQFIGDFYFDMKCARPMPLYGVPGNLDHF